MNLLPNKSQIDRVFFAIVFVAVAFSTVTVTNTAVAQGAQVRDPLLHAMETELAREKALLLLPGMQRPYFIEYRLDDMNTYEAVATYGALAREEANRQRIVRVTVRIGDYVFDSSSSKGEGTVELAPTDDNPEALRYALWVATDAAYKNALRAYSAKQAALKQFQSEQAQHDFA
jgi:TldD protein